MQVEIIVTPSCTYRSGTSSKGNSYTMAQAFAILPGVDFPQKFDYYCQKENEVLAPGEYIVPLSGEVKDGRLVFSCDPRQARKKPAAVSPVAAQQK